MKPTGPAWERLGLFRYVDPATGFRACDHGTGPGACRFCAMVDAAYEAGREDERASLVAWLRSILWPAPWRRRAAALAVEVERGDHEAERG